MSRARADTVKSRTPLSSPLIVIEHLEPYTSTWMYIELRHASLLAGRKRFWLTNVKRRCEKTLLAELGTVYTESISTILHRLEDYRIVVLDPQTDALLTPEDFRAPAAVVIGGIMGGHPPLGRTRSMLTSKLQGKNVAVRSLGPGQYTIDGAVYMALKVAGGARLAEIPVSRGLRLRHPGGWHVELPFTYPVENGKPVISRDEVEYILYKLEEDEEKALREGVEPSIC